jgi:hypothetical protein
MPTTAGDQRWMRLFARLFVGGLLLMFIARLIEPRLAGDAHPTGDPAWTF